MAEIDNRKTEEREREGKGRERFREGKEREKDRQTDRGSGRESE